MKTFEDVLNEVMKLLRETEVSDINDEYVQLIGAWTNIVKEQIEGTWDWHTQRQFVNFTSTAGSREIDLTAALTPGSRLMYEKHPVVGQLPQVFDVEDENQGFRLIEVPYARLKGQSIRFDKQTTDKPMHFAVQEVADGLKLHLLETPTVSRDYVAEFYVPDADYVNLSDEVKVPFRVLVAGVLWIAAAERGEELGLSTDILKHKYDDLLTKAVARDMGEEDTIMVPV